MDTATSEPDTDNQLMDSINELLNTNTIDSIRDESDNLPPIMTKKCKYCNKRFKKWLNHEQTHAGLRPYLCIKCGMTFRYESIMRSHANYHLALNGVIKETYPCGVCSEHLHSEDGIRDHVKRLHTVEWPVACDLCTARFTSTIYLEYHLESFHANEGNITCWICSETFISKLDQMKHIGESHTIDKPNEYKKTKKKKKYTRINNADNLSGENQNSIEFVKIETVDLLRVDNDIDNQIKRIDDSDVEFKVFSNDGDLAQPNIQFVNVNEIKKELIETIEDFNKEEFIQPPELIQINLKEEETTPSQDEVLKCNNENIQIDDEDQRQSPCDTDFVMDEFSEQSVPEELPIKTAGSPKNDRTNVKTKSGRKSKRNQIIGSPKPMPTIQTVTEALKCNVCGKQFESLTLLIEHQTRIHTDVLSYSCELCDDRFLTARNLNQHLKLTHKTVRPPIKYKCTYCEKVFKTCTVAKDHENLHTGEKPYSCKECGINFIFGATYRRHLRKHAGTRKFFECDICGKIIYSRSFLTVHMRMHANVHTYICDICDMGCRTAYRLNAHRKLIHKIDSSLLVSETPIYRKRRKKHKCQYCDKTFGQIATMKDHENMHTGEKPYLCTECGTSFAYGGVLKNHMKLHANRSELYKCDVCGKILYSDQNLTDHMRLHTNERPFTCDLCGCRVISRRHLTYHISKYHGANEGIVLPNSKPHTHFCSLCDKKYRSIVALNFHLRKHVEVRKFPCSDCGATFTKARFLKGHRTRIHLGK